MRGFNKKEPKSRRAGGRDVQRISGLVSPDLRGLGENKDRHTAKIQQNHADPATERGVGRCLCRQQPHQRQIQILGEVQRLSGRQQHLGRAQQERAIGEARPVRPCQVYGKVLLFSQLTICL